MPLCPTEALEEQVKKAGVANTICAPDEEAYLDIEWWRGLAGFDWCVAVTQGVGRTVDYVIDPGLQLAKRGLIILDRLTFLEPTHKRRNFLTESPLSELIILNPRPEFRSDQLKAKDSVTSAWFVFDKLKNPKEATKIEYAVSWQRPRALLRE